MKRKNQLAAIIALAIILTLAACKKESITTLQPQSKEQSTIAARTIPQSKEQSTIAARTMPPMKAYYDAALFTVNMKQMPGNATQALLAHNGSINEIYASNDLDEPQTFIPVINAIQGDGFNPLWVQFFIVFKVGSTPHQFFSDTEVDAAVASGEITLTNTGEVYRCSVIGH